jgi:hypothetical protein
MSAVKMPNRRTVQRDRSDGGMRDQRAVAKTRLYKSYNRTGLLIRYVNKLSTNRIQQSRSDTTINVRELQICAITWLGIEYRFHV